MSSEYYIWSVDRKAIEVRLNLTVVDRLQALVSWAFHNSTKEIHGILLGRSVRRGHKRRVYIEELDLFDPASGPPRPRHRPWLDCVGLFRSHVRDGLRLDHVDASLISNYFTNPAMVYLLVKPAHGAPSTAGFFIQEDGRVRGYQSYREFPFHAETLRNGRFRVISESDAGAPASWWKWVAGIAVISAMLAGGWWLWPRVAPAAAHASQPAAPPPPVPIRATAPAASPVSPEANQPAPGVVEVAPEQAAPAATEASAPIRPGAGQTGDADRAADADRAVDADRKSGRTKSQPKSRRTRRNHSGGRAAVEQPARVLRRAVSHVPGLGFLREHKRAPADVSSGE